MLIGDETSLTNLNLSDSYLLIIAYYKVVKWCTICGYRSTKIMVILR